MALGALPAELQDDIAALTGCVSGAALVSDMERMLKEAGFADAKVVVKPESQSFIKDWLPGSGIERHVASAYIEGTKR